MKKRILALVCAAVMVLGMSLSVCAAGSSSAPAKAEEILVTGDNVFGQTFGTDTLDFFGKDTKADGANIGRIDDDAAKRMIAFIRKTWGQEAFIASMFDMSGKTGVVSLTNSNVWKGQTVYVVHEVSKDNFEIIKATVTADNKLEFNVSSCSPFGIVVLSANAPKTGEIIAMICALAAVSGIGAVACAKKAKND